MNYNVEFILIQRRFPANVVLSYGLEIIVSSDTERETDLLCEGTVKLFEV